MNPRTTWFLLGLAALLFALIVFIERPYREARNKPPDTRVLPNLKISAVTSLQLYPAGKFEIRLEKTNGIWQLTRPFNYPANAEKVSTLLQTLSQLNWETQITAQELRGRTKVAEEYGLDNPQFSIVLQEGEALRRLHVGKSSIMGDQIYLQVAGAEGICIAGTNLMNILPPQADDWRDSQALPTDAFAANVLEVHSGKNFFRLERNPTNNLWRMTRPVPTRADNARLRELLNQLHTLSTREFVADDPNIDFEKFGLPNTAAQSPELELVFFQNTNLLAGLQVGISPTNNPTLAYARRVNQSAVFLVATAPLDPWRAPSSEFRERHLIDLDSSSITNFQIQGEDQFTLERVGTNTWRVTQPEVFEADPELVQNDLLLAFSRIEVNFENDAVADYAPFGLTNPVLQCSATGVFRNIVSKKLEPVVEQVSFGSVETNRIFVRRSDEAGVFSITPAEFAVFPRASWQLRDRRIWNFSPDEVAAITIQQQGKTRKVIRNEVNDWALAPGSQGAINPFAFEAAIDEFSHLKAIFWSARDEKDRAKFGFKDLDFQLTIEFKDGRKKTIEFGSFAPVGHPYAAVDMNGRRAVFEFPLPLYFNFVRKDLSILPLPLANP